LRERKPRTLNLEPRTLNSEQGAVTGLSRDGGSSDRPAAAERKYDLDERLLEFAAVVIEVSEKLPNTRAGNHLAGQFLRAGTSPYGNHGEAQAPESAEDFIHKMNICLKELREAFRWARLINRKRWLGNDGQLAFVLREGDELIRIFKASIQTAERNRTSSRRGGSSGTPPNS
jgi:four helix bundle protein